MRSLIIILALSGWFLHFNYKFERFLDFVGDYKGRAFPNRKFLFKMPILSFFLNFYDIL